MRIKTLRIINNFAVAFKYITLVVFSFVLSIVVSYLLIIHDPIFRPLSQYILLLWAIVWAFILLNLIIGEIIERKGFKP